MGYPPGLFCWADVAVPDAPAGAEFYSAVFGWDAKETDGGILPYTMFVQGGLPIAGMGVLTAEQQRAGWSPIWSSYVLVEDADLIASQAAALGASLLMDPFPVPGSGRMFFASDPVGAVIGFWEAGEHAGAGVFNRAGAMCWNELACRDVEAATDFYTALLGWKTDTITIGGAEYTTVLVGDRPNGGIYRMGDDLEDLPPAWFVWFGVETTDRSAAQVIDLGGEVIRPPYDGPFGRAALVSDPQGAVFGMMQVPP